MCGPHLPLILPLLQLLTLAQLADLLARLAVQAVCAAAAVLSAQAGSAGAALLPALLLEDEDAVRGRLERMQREEPGLLVLALDVFAQGRRLQRELSLELLSAGGGQALVRGARGARPCSGSGHGGPGGVLNTVRLKNSIKKSA